MNIIVGRQNTEYVDCVELDLSLWFKKGKFKCQTYETREGSYRKKGIG